MGSELVYTALLYLAIIIATTFFMYLYEKDNTGKKVIYIIISFTILWAFSIFRNSGIDLEVYREIFDNATESWARDYYVIDIGYLYINKSFRLITNSFFIFNSTISFLTIYLVYKVLFYFKDRINLTLAVLLFASMFYFQSYSLIRIYFASSVILYAIVLLDSKKTFLALVLFGFAVSLHFSSIIMIIIILIFYKIKEFRFTSLLLLFAIMVLTIYPQSIQILKNIPRYGPYITSANFNGIGYFQIIIHLPLYYFIYISKKKEYDTDLYQNLFFFTNISLAFGLLSYSIDLFGRMQVYTMLIYIIYIPMFFIEYKKRNKNSYLLSSFIVSYALFRFVFYIHQYGYLDGIIPYVKKSIEVLTLLTS